MPSFHSLASALVTLFATTLFFNALPVQAAPDSLVHGGLIKGMVHRRHAQLDAVIRDINSQALVKRESGEFTWFYTGTCVEIYCGALCMFNGSSDLEDLGVLAVDTM